MNGYKCSSCGRKVCSACLRFFFLDRKEFVIVDGKKFKVEDLYTCLDCETDIVGCQFCKESKKVDHKWFKPDREARLYYNCHFCQKFVCFDHSHDASGVFQKYGSIRVCEECLEKKKCIKCKGTLLKVRGKYYEYKFNKKFEITCGNCVRKRKEESRDTLYNSNERHTNLQQLLMPFFKTLLKCNVQWERRLGDYEVVDVIVHNPKNEDLYGLEIKSGSTKKSFQQQLSKYEKYFDFFYVIIKESELEKCLKNIKGSYGIFVLNEKQDGWFLYRPAQRKTLKAKDLLNNMKNYGLFWLCLHFGVKDKPTEVRRMGRSDKIKGIIKKMKSRKKIKHAYNLYALKENYVFGTSITNKEWGQTSGKVKQKSLLSIIEDT